MFDYRKRIAAAQRALLDSGAGLLVVAPTDQMRYLIGWAEGGHERLIALLLPAAGEPVLLVPSMNAREAAANPAGVDRVVGWDDGPQWYGQVRDLLNEWGAPGAAMADDELLAVHLLHLQRLFPATRWQPAGELLAGLRQLKTPDELAALEQAARDIDAVCEESLAGLREGVTEREFGRVILDGIARRGKGPSFSPLVCFGENGAHPHHLSGDTRLKRGDVVIIDIGSADTGYASDITRTVAFGEPRDPGASEVYATVYSAHMAARSTARPGTSAEQVDSAAREVIQQAGYGPQFLHRTGHGIGLSTHEPPYIVQGNSTVLQPSMCFSVEPGIYLPGRFGVRIENIVTVTETGSRSLNAEPPAELRIVEPV
ncbi:MAG: aminopeptidase P family protein [Armatimonadetes bacterium]|nr:aminopeptidase P family protein [Armatimonadota bacterium]MDE2207849.1 aminopeptidase P family protein [Armatimonadota bacterium]